jgi:hypothetical protein
VIDNDEFCDRLQDHSAGINQKNWIGYFGSKCNGIKKQTKAMEIALNDK